MAVDENTGDPGTLLADPTRGGAVSPTRKRGTQVHRPGAADSGLASYLAVRASIARNRLPRLRFGLTPLPGQVGISEPF